MIEIQNTGSLFYLSQNEHEAVVVTTNGVIRKNGDAVLGKGQALEAMPATLERDCYTYRQAVRFGMVKPTPKKITFYFERRCI